MRGEIIGFFIIKRKQEALAVLCSVVKHLGSSKVWEKVGETIEYVSCNENFHWSVYVFVIDEVFLALVIILPHPGVRLQKTRSSRINILNSFLFQ